MTRACGPVDETSGSRPLTWVRIPSGNPHERMKEKSANMKPYKVNNVRGICAEGCNYFIREVNARGGINTDRGPVAAFADRMTAERECAKLNAGGSKLDIVGNLPADQVRYRPLFSRLSHAASSTPARMAHR
jgi:hypothetical protein